jgi:hypothetical protein
LFSRVEVPLALHEGAISREAGFVASLAGENGRHGEGESELGKWRSRWADSEEPPGLRRRACTNFLPIATTRLLPG